LGFSRIQHMGRNSLAGKSNGKSKSAKYYAKNPKARKKKTEYNKKYNATPSQKKYRSQLNAFNRKKGTYGNGDGLDASHKGGKITRLEKASSNRARNKKGSLKPKKKK